MRRIVFLLALLVAGLPCWSAENFLLPCWAELFFTNIHPPKLTSAPVADQVKKLSSEFQAKVAVTESRRDLRSLVLGPAMIKVTDYITRRNGHAYPFYYVRRGIPQKVRLWTKMGPEAQPDIDKEINSWIARVKSFPEDRKKIVARTAAIQIEAELLRQALKSNPTFPLSLELPVDIVDGQVAFETRSFQNESALRDDLDRVLTTESDRFDHLPSRDFSNAKFLFGREFEQAQLLGRLEIVLSELQKFPKALLDAQKRKGLIAEIAELLDRTDLEPREGVTYKENRRIFIDEINFYAGTGRDVEVPNDGLRLNDLIDLGIEKGKLSIKSQLLRLGIVYGVIQVMSSAVAYEMPAVEDELSLYFRESVAIQEIVAKPDMEFAKASHDFLENRYGLHSESGHLVWTVDARKAADRIAEARKEFLDDLKKKNVEIAEVDEALKLASAKISPELFAGVVNSSDETTAKQQIMSAGLKDSSVVEHLMGARAKFRNALAQNRSEAQTLLMEAYADYEIEYQ